MELKNPLVTVIVPNYNHEKYLEQRLESILNQTYSNYEVILMDDCSTDNSLTILNQYKNHEKVTTCIFNESNTGNTFKQWVKGIQLAKGELIWIAETDDYCDAHFLEKLVQPFNDDSNLVLAYCQSNRVNEDGLVKGNWITHTDDLDNSFFLNDFIIDGNIFLEKFLIIKNVIPNASAALFRSNAINNNVFFELSQNFKTCGDWLFYINFIINKRVAYISDSLNNFRYHSSSVIARTKINESQISITQIDIEMRNSINSFLRDKEIPNLKKILKKNTSINRNNIYNKGKFYIKLNQKIKGYFIILRVFDIYFKHLRVTKRLINSLKKS